MSAPSTQLPTILNAEISRSGSRFTFFSLRALLMTLEIASAVWVFMHLLGAMWTTLLLWTGVLIAVHVAANAWGTRAAARQRDLPPDGERPAPVEIIAFAPATQLGHQRPLGWQVLVGIGLGAALGATLGLVVLWLAYHETLGYDGLVVGGVSATALGGLLGFLGSVFLNTTLRAVREASAACRTAKSLDS